MAIYVLAGGIAACYLVLFILSHGLFGSSAEYLRRRIPSLSACTDKETLSRALQIFLIFTGLAAALTASKSLSDTAAEGYLVRNEYGGTEENEALILEKSGSEQRIDLTVDARSMSDAEIRSCLQDTADRLSSAVFQNTAAEHVDTDLILPDSLEDSPARISWMTDNPSVLDFDGCNLYESIGRGEDAAGIPVTLTAEISLEEQLLEREFSLTVFPRKMSAEEETEKRALRAISDANDSSESKVSLPEELDGEAVSWRRAPDNDGLVLLLLGLIAAVLFVYAGAHRKQQAEEDRQEQMLRDYPAIISKLVLLVSAGMSLRSAFFQIRKDYRLLLSQGSPPRAGYEEILTVTREMEHGVPEVEAYGNMGRRSSSSVYKTFATLLTQNLTKGGNDMARLLTREADEAYDARKKRARVLGEEAGTKLLLPMLLMLCVVMVILMVPAFFAFF